MMMMIIIIKTVLLIPTGSYDSWGSSHKFDMGKSDLPR